jgi:hypothetical protein
MFIGQLSVGGKGVICRGASADSLSHVEHYWYLLFPRWNAGCILLIRVAGILRFCAFAPRRRFDS